MPYAIGHRIHAAIHVINSRKVLLSSRLVQNDIETLLAEILSEGATRMRTEWPSMQRVAPTTTNEYVPRYFDGV